MLILKQEICETYELKLIGDYNFLENVLAQLHHD